MHTSRFMSKDIMRKKIFLNETLNDQNQFMKFLLAKITKRIKR
jgi:hypothetical protein